MRQFLMLLGVAAVAGAMYVAAASGSQRSAGPTAKQFKALKTQVAALSKRLKTTQNNLDGLAFAYVHCSLPSGIDINQRNGYQWGGTGQTTALDLGSGNPTYVLTPFNAADSDCVSLLGTAALRHRTASVIARKFGQKH